MSRAYDRVDVEFVLSSGVVVHDYSVERAAPPQASLQLAPDVEWLLAPGASICLHGGCLSVSLDLLPDSVSVSQGRVTVARTRRTIELQSDEAVLRRLAEKMSTGRTHAALIGCVAPELRDAAHEVLVSLIGWGAVVPRQGARPRLSHEWSMRGARSRGRLSPSEVADLTFESKPRDGRAAIELAAPAALPVDSLAEVLRQRRSVTKYGSLPISLDQLSQLLGHACGVTGQLLMGDRRLPLRAYPSPGALYAVDVFIIPTRVVGLGDGVFRYESDLHALVRVHDRRIDPVSFCLPDVRSVVGGIAAFIALSISLPRATQKYGDESYRILVAEAGCIAENLVLVAHSLGLRAGPFTGVFDRLVDQAIVVGRDESLFVVGVLVGHEEKP